MAEAITGRGGDDLLALKRNQVALHREVEAFFADLATTGIETVCEIDKDHGRIETRTTSVGHEVGWVSGSRRHLGEPRFPRLTTPTRTKTRTESRGRTSGQTRHFIASARLSPTEAVRAVRSHRGIVLRERQCLSGDIVSDVSDLWFTASEAWRLPMWTTENRARYDRSRLRYSSDLTDEEWALIATLIPPAKRGGGKRSVDLRAVVNGTY